MHIHEAAEKLNRSDQTIYRMLKRKELFPETEVRDGEEVPIPATVRAAEVEHYMRNPHPKGGTISWGNRINQWPPAEEYQEGCTLKQAADYLGITPRGAYSAFKRGNLKSLGRSPLPGDTRYMISWQSVHEYERDHLGKYGGYRPRRPKDDESPASPSNGSAREAIEAALGIPMPNTP